MKNKIKFIYICKMPYNIGLLEFITKKESENYTRNIINDIGENIVNNTHKHFQFLINLLNNHHKKDAKIGCGVNAFIIIKNARGTGYETQLRRIDGTCESFSWKDCANHTYKNKLQMLDSAMRNAIDSQIQDFRANNLEVCSNKCNNNTKCAVDHKSPTFYDIKNRFLATIEYTPSEFDKELSTHQVKFRDCDNDFKAKWQLYHKQEATLQFLCSTCHKEKTKNDIRMIKSQDSL